MGRGRSRIDQQSGKKRKIVSPSLLKRINRNAAGIDCGAETHYVAVPPERDPEPVRSFKTFTTDLNRLADWLAACGIKTVAMEATGVYWIPIFSFEIDKSYFTSVISPPPPEYRVEAHATQNNDREPETCRRLEGVTFRTLPRTNLWSWPMTPFPSWSLHNGSAD